MLWIFLNGFTVSMGLILAIGAQNTFVLKQGLKRQHVLWICLVCALSDSILITLGVYGFAEVIERFPQFILFAQYFGAAFLIWYALLHLRQALQTQQIAALELHTSPSLMQSVMLCLGLTWLNPHVYLDTVVLIGSISAQFSHGKLYFALGAIMASWLFFFSLGYAARFMAPYFQSAKAWRVLDLLIAITMLLIAISLLRMQL